MKWMATLITALALAASASAQQKPQTPPATPAQLEIQKEADLVRAKIQVDYEQLKGLEVFADYMTSLNRFQQLQQQYAAAAAPPSPTKPAKEKPQGNAGQAPHPAAK
jgi:hypothetical protein